MSAERKELDINGSDTDPPTNDRLSHTTDKSIRLKDDSEVYPNPVAAQFEIDDYSQSGSHVSNPSNKQKGTCSRYWYWCMVLGLVLSLIVALLLILLGCAVYLLVEISSLKSGTVACRMQSVGVSHLNASRDFLSHMLHQEFSTILEQHHNLNLSLNALFHMLLNQNEALINLNASFHQQLSNQQNQLVESSRDQHLALMSLNSSFHQQINDQQDQSQVIVDSLRRQLDNHQQMTTESFRGQYAALVNLNSTFKQILNDQQSQSQMLADSLISKLNDHQNRTEMIAESLKGRHLALLSLHSSFHQQLQNQSQTIAEGLNQLNSHQNQSQTIVEYLRDQYQALASLKSSLSQQLTKQQNQYQNVAENLSGLHLALIELQNQSQIIAESLASQLTDYHNQSQTVADSLKSQHLTLNSTIQQQFNELWNIMSQIVAEVLASGHQNLSQTIAESLRDQHQTLLSLNSSFNQHLTEQQNQSHNVVESLSNLHFALISLNSFIKQQLDELQNSNQSQIIAESLTNQLTQHLALNSSFHQQLNELLNQSQMTAEDLKSQLSNHQSQSQIVAEDLTNQYLALISINSSFYQQLNELQDMFQIVADSLTSQLNDHLNQSVMVTDNFKRQQLAFINLNLSFSQQLEELLIVANSLKIELSAHQNLSQMNAESLGNQLIALQVLRGQYPVFPLTSCAALPPGSPSSYYWVSTSNGSSIYVYCDTTRSCGGVVGGWTRVAYLDMTNSSQQCPGGLRLRTDDGLRTCGVGVDPGSCSQSFLHTNGLSFSRVCGRIKAYQVGSSDSFGNSGRGTNRNINQNYVDGVSLTYGSPRQHIWTFAAGLDEASTHPPANCPCTDSNTASQSTPPPAFVGNDYFCDTGISGNFINSRFYNEDPLWDGAGCGPRNSCCMLNSPPWFYKQLSGTTSSDIEMRVCRDEHVDNEDTAIEMIELYVQ